MLLLHDFISPDGQRVGLLSGPGGKREPLRDWLRAEHREQEAQERSRLLYVAATRARRRLCLVGALPEDHAASPRAGSLLATLWSGIGQGSATSMLPAEQRTDLSAAAGPDAKSAARTAADEDAGGPTDDFFELPLVRLRFDAEIPLPPAVPTLLAEEAGSRPEFEWVQPAAVQVGTLIHRELQRIAEQLSDRTDDDSGFRAVPASDRQRYRRELILLGVEHEDLDGAADRVSEALERAVSDPVGRWILRPRSEAWSELRLSARRPTRIEHVQIDRSFVDDSGVRWIIDYKTGRHLGADVEGFLAAELDRYRPQLERYAEIVAAIDPRPIRVGLYFPLLGRLRDWVPEIAQQRARPEAGVDAPLE